MLAKTKLENYGFPDKIYFYLLVLWIRIILLFKDDDSDSCGGILSHFVYMYLT
jgi:hypothetical protein